MFIEDIKQIQQTEKQAKKIIETAEQQGRELVYKAEQDSRLLQQELEIELERFRREKMREAEDKAKKDIEQLSLENGIYIKKIKENALKNYMETAQFVYKQLLLL